MRLYQYMDFLHQMIVRYYGSDWAGMTLMCLSIYMLGNQKRMGFLFGIGSCIGWFIFGILTRSIPDLIAQCIVTVMHIRGYRKWNVASSLI